VNGLIAAKKPIDAQGNSFVWFGEDWRGLAWFAVDAEDGILQKATKATKERPKVGTRTLTD